MNQTTEDNVFTRQSEFIDNDHRQHRLVYDKNIPVATGRSYVPTKEFMFTRHMVMLPPEMIKGKTILDVGSCYAATGAWCLDNGATHYTGLEPQKAFVNKSSELLKKYYDTNQFEIVENTIEEWTTSKKYDIVIASGILYGVFDPYKFVEKLTLLATENIIVESQHPFFAGKKLWSDITDEERRARMKWYNIIQILDDNCAMVDAESNSNFIFTGIMVSIAALCSLFRRNGWSHDNLLYDTAEKEIPMYYNIAFPTGQRYMSKFYPNNVSAPAFSDIYKDPTAKKIPWSGNLTNK